MDDWLMDEVRRAMDALHNGKWSEDDIESLGSTVEGVCETLQKLVDENVRLTTALEQITDHPIGYTWESEDILRIARETLEQVNAR